MIIRGGIILAATTALGACVNPGGGANPWDPAAHQALLGVAADDPWCGYMRDLRRHLDEGAAVPPDDVRAARLSAVRAEAEATRGGDVLWPFRKGLICEYIDGAAEERSEFDWVTAAEFLTQARRAVEDRTPAETFSPIVPVFDLLDGEEPETLRPVDLTTPDYCTGVEASGLALTQQRGGVIERLSARGALQRAPDWLAMAQVAYHRWGAEQREGHQITPGAVDFGGIPFHCTRFHQALAGTDAFVIKDNLVFLLPERDDPTAAGRLEVTDADGVQIILDRVLAAAQLDADGRGGEAVELFEDDVASSPGLSGARRRLDNLPAPVVFNLFFDFNRALPEPDAPEVAALRAELLGRSPSEPLRIALSGQADCVGSRRNNRRIARARVEAVLRGVIRPALSEAGFAADALSDPTAFKRVVLGEVAPEGQRGGRCTPSPQDRRVVVVVQ